MTAPAQIGDPVVNMVVFGVFVLVTLGIVYRVSHRDATPDDYFAAGGGFSGTQNGIAMSGDFLSAASFLGISGAIAVYGYDGFVYSVSWVVAWLVALLVVGEGLRNTGRFTMGDVMAYRLRQGPVRAARRPRRWSSRSSTWSRRWPGRAAWSRCCSPSIPQAGSPR